MEKVDPQDLELRTAMWECHNYRCFYSRRPLDFDQMVLDHIVSKKGRTEEQYKDLLKRLGLSEDFEINSVYNLVPCSPTENWRKGGDDNIRGMILFLHDAEKIAPKIIDRMKKLKERTNVDKNVAHIKSFIQRGGTDLEGIFNRLVGVENSFLDTSPTIEDYGINKSYTYSHSSVYLSGILPKYPSMNTSCSLAFRSLQIRGCVIDLKAEDFSRCFIKGLHTEPSLGIRPFIKAPHSDNDSKYWVNFGNVTFSLNIYELQQLCDVVDGFTEEYIKSLKIIEEELGTNSMTLSKAIKGGYRLLRVKKELWNKLIEFSLEHDSENGSTPWHIFEANRFKLKIFTDDNDKRYDPGYHVILECEKEKGLDDINDDIWIVWSPYLSFDEAERYFERGRWNPSMALRWLIGEYIPFVYSQYKVLQKNKLEYYITYLGSEEFNAVEVDNHRSLLRFVNGLQSFYNENYNSYVTINEFKGLIAAVYEGLNRIPIKDYSYVAGSLGYDRTCTIEEILKDLQMKQIGIPDKLISSSTVDYYLRAFGFTLEKGVLGTINIDVKYIVDCLRPLSSHKQNQELVDKYAEL